MSRSFKKNPVVSIACCGKGAAMKSAKTKACRRVRRIGKEDLPSDFIDNTSNQKEVKGCLLKMQNY